VHAQAWFGASAPGKPLQADGLSVAEGHRGGRRCAQADSLAWGWDGFSGLGVSAAWRKQEAGMSDIQGGCRCGAVRYTLAVDTLPRSYACHCLDCQTWSGSAFSLQFFLPETSLSVSGLPTVFELMTPSGNVSLQRMCAVCHTRIYNSNSARPGLVVVRAGTLDRSDELDVVAHIWVKRKQSWLTLPSGVPSWSLSAPAAEFMQALAPE
jgi:hypothetical protein